ncbi:MAG TPA: site-specific integrase [Gaiellaceae bacterium]|jgi:integrase
MILFAAATALRPAEWIALEKRDVDREERVVYVRRSFTRRELKFPKTEASMRAVPLQARALEALDRITNGNGSPLLFPGERGGYLDIHHFRPYQWRPAQKAAGITPLRRVYDLRHTFAAFALRASISTFDLSRYMGASLTMIDRHYGHLARDGREHAIKPPRRAQRAVDAGGRWVDTDPEKRRQRRQRKGATSRLNGEAL